MAALMILILMAGCGNPPRIYTMAPDRVEAIRSETMAIGVHLDPSVPETRVMLPAKGVWGGAKRGTVLGATLPAMIGFVSPIPGGTALGILMAPLGALVGCGYGVFTALPTEEVDDAEAMLHRAASELKKMGLRDRFRDRIVSLGNTLTEFRFVPWPGEQQANGGGGQSPASPPHAVDTKLSIRFVETGLRGPYHIDPPMDIFLTARVRLIRTRDDAIVLDESFTCASDEERMFKAWSAGGGRAMIEEFQSCVPELAEKIVDDFFRVHPIQW